MRKNDAFDAKIVNTRLTKIFIAIFAPDERLPSSTTLGCANLNDDDDNDGDNDDDDKLLFNVSTSYLPAVPTLSL